MTARATTVLDCTPKALANLLDPLVKVSYESEDFAVFVLLDRTREALRALDWKRYTAGQRERCRRVDLGRLAGHAALVEG